MAQDLTTLVDMLNVCHAKLRFLTDVFSQEELRTFRFSEDGLSGIYFILFDIESEIEFVANEMSAKEV